MYKRLQSENTQQASARAAKDARDAANKIALDATLRQGKSNLGGKLDR